VVTSIISTVPNSHSLILSWKTPLAPGSDILHYMVRVSSYNGILLEEENVIPPNNTYIITELSKSIPSYMYTS